jgi:hypothetical protein
LELSLSGAANGQYRIEASANLADWETLTTVTADIDGHAEYADPQGTQETARFYRAVGL